MLAQGSRPSRTQRVLSMHQHSADISPQRLPELHCTALRGASANSTGTGGKPEGISTRR